MTKHQYTSNKALQSQLALGCLLVFAQAARSTSLDELTAIAASSYNPSDTIAQSLNSPHNSKANVKTVLQGKAEVSEHMETGSNLQAWQASQVYKEGVKALSTRDYNFAAQFFKIAGDGFAAAGHNEKFLAEARYAEGQARRLLGQKQAAAPLYQEAIALFKQYDPLSPYLKAAMDNLRLIAPPLQARAAKSDIRLKALAEISGIQAVDRNVVLKGSATDTDDLIALKAQKASSVTEAHIKKTVLQAFVKMTCLETAELGSNYYTAADRYVPLKADGKNIAVPASSGFNAPVINIKLNGHSYNVGVDLPELSASRRTVYLVTDGKNVLAIDPATYDVWKLYSRTDKHTAEFDWRKLTHQKDVQKRINPPKAAE
jgi:hypothetical protein